MVSRRDFLSIGALAAGIRAVGVASAPLRDITLRDVTIASAAQPYEIRNVANLTLNDVRVNGRLIPARIQ